MFKINPFNQVRQAQPIAQGTRVTSPFNQVAQAMPSFAGARENHEKGLSQMGVGALGDNAINVKNGKLGQSLNLLA